MNMAYENPTFSSSEFGEVNEVPPVEMALEVHDAWLTYGKREQILGLKSANLHVPRGTIYALLGPSGCGKTTLLSSSVGIRFLKQGSIRIFGESPGSKESGVPGPWIGYMPQELAMYVELTAEETLSFFGRVHCMPAKLRQERLDLLLNLLEIPRNRRVRLLSGGQQRRLSLAAALLHDPPLLVLDEPTVGVDPLLRKSIWKYLKELTADQGKTVIITTHYVEEARAAHTVGLMRAGRILVEENPQLLMNKYNVTTLEDVFLQVCINEEHVHPEDSAMPALEDIEPNSSSGKTETDINENDETVLPNSDSASGFKKVACKQNTEYDEDSNGTVSWRTAEDGELSGVLELKCEEELNSKLKQKTKKNLEEGNEQKGHFAIKFEKTENVVECEKGKSAISSVSWENKQKSLVPAEAEYFELPQQRNRKALPKLNKTLVSDLNVILGVTWKNVILMRRTILMVIFAFIIPMNNVCLTRMLWGHTPFDLSIIVVNNDASSLASQRMIDKLDHRILRIRYSSSFEEAVDLVKAGQAVAALHIPDGFILNNLRRIRLGLVADNMTICKSRYHIHMDRSNMVTAGTVFLSVLRSTHIMTQDLEKTLGAEPGALTFPLSFQKPIVGNPEPEMSDVYTMGFLAESVFLTGLAFSTLIFLSERNNGMFDRNRISGLKPIHLVISHFLVQTVVTLVQIGLLLLLLVVIQMDVQGSKLLLVFILYLSSYFGMSVGVFISALTQSTSAALIMAFGFAVMTALGTGLIWPTEAMAHWIQYIAYIHPNNFSLRAVKLIITHGLGLGHFQIWASILISIFWTVIALTLAVIGLTNNTSDRVKIKVIV